MLSGPRKRTASENVTGDDDSDSDDEEHSQSFIKRSTAAMRDAVYYITDMDRFEPPKKRTKCVALLTTL